MLVESCWRFESTSACLTFLVEMVHCLPGVSWKISIAWIALGHENGAEAENFQLHINQGANSLPAPSVWKDLGGQIQRKLPGWSVKVGARSHRSVNCELPKEDQGSWWNFPSQQIKGVSRMFGLKFPRSLVPCHLAQHLVHLCCFMTVSVHFLYW